jgi:hypothetical protein
VRATVSGAERCVVKIFNADEASIGARRTSKYSIQDVSAGKRPRVCIRMHEDDDDDHDDALKVARFAAAAASSSLSSRMTWARRCFVHQYVAGWRCNSSRADEEE